MDIYCTTIWVSIFQNENEDNELEAVGKKGRKKPAYEGGLVLDPKKGISRVVLKK